MDVQHKPLIDTYHRLAKRTDRNKAVLVMLRDRASKAADAHDAEMQSIANQAHGSGARTVEEIVAAIESSAVTFSRQPRIAYDASIRAVLNEIQRCMTECRDVHTQLVVAGVAPAELEAAGIIVPVAEATPSPVADWK